MVLLPEKPDDKVTCPYEKSHQIHKSRLQYHIVRCAKNHELSTKIRCPWNPLHIVEKCEYLDHIHNRCEDLVNAMGSTVLTDEASGGDVASIPVGAADEALPPSTEDWDAAPAVGTYDPLQRTAERPILRGSIGLSKAKKKVFRNKERLRHQELDQLLPMSTTKKDRSPEKSEGSKPCRMPHNQSMALSADVSMIDELNFSKMSDDCDNVLKLRESLRQPHEPSPGLFYRAGENNDFLSFSNGKTLFDCQFEDLPEADSEYSVPSASSRSVNVDEFEKSTKESAKTSQNYPPLNPKCGAIKKTRKNVVEAKPTRRRDEASSLEAKVSTPQSPPEKEDDVDDLALKLKNIDMKRQELEEEKAAILRKMVKKALEKQNDDNIESNKENLSENSEQKNGFNEINRKCAATLGSPKTNGNSRPLGFGRGRGALDFEALEKWKPIGSRDTQQDSA